VVAYRDGWRAQFARPVAILRESRSESQLREIADQLGIPLVSSGELERVPAELGRPGRMGTVRQVTVA
jgi:hypothetical protein